MITAVDSNVLLDILLPDANFARQSRAALEGSHREGIVLSCEVVWAEVMARFPDVNAGRSALALLGVEYHALDAGTAALAGRSWGEYRRRGGPRERIVADFLIGAHALHAADRLLTRDRGFYRRYFTELDVLDPTA